MNNYEEIDKLPEEIQKEIKERIMKGDIYFMTLKADEVLKELDEESKLKAKNEEINELEVRLTNLKGEAVLRESIPATEIDDNGAVTQAPQAQAQYSRPLIFLALFALNAIVFLVGVGIAKLGSHVMIERYKRHLPKALIETIDGKSEDSQDDNKPDTGTCYRRDGIEYKIGQYELDIKNKGKSIFDLACLASTSIIEPPYLFLHLSRAPVPGYVTDANKDLPAIFYLKFSREVKYETVVSFMESEGFTPPGLYELLLVAASGYLTSERSLILLKSIEEFKTNQNNYLASFSYFFMDRIKNNQRQLGEGYVSRSGTFSPRAEFIVVKQVNDVEWFKLPVNYAKSFRDVILDADFGAIDPRIMAYYGAIQEGGTPFVSAELDAAIIIYPKYSSLYGIKYDLEKKDLRPATLFESLIFIDVIGSRLLKRVDHDFLILDDKWYGGSIVPIGQEIRSLSLVMTIIGRKLELRNGIGDNAKYVLAIKK